MIEQILQGGAAELEALRARVSGRRGDAGLVATVERAVAAAPGEAIRFDASGAATIEVGEHRFAAGTFTTPSIGALRERAIAAAGGAPVTGRVRLSVIAGADVLSDIGALQGAADDSTLFQVASQFNCLESPGPYVTEVSSYPGDPTQGPRAAYSAFPGALVRHHAAPGPDGSRFAQTTAGRQLDLLARALPWDVGQVRSGYLTAADITDPAGAAAALDDGFEHICVGVHHGLEVVFGHDWHGPVAGAPRIAQVLTSTLAAGSYSRGVRIDGPFALLCRQLQRAAYLGTLLAAAALGKRTAVLTLIGGGVFGNPHPIIWDAIEWACGELDAITGAALHVVVNGHGGLEDRPRVAALVAARAGVIAELRR